MKSKKDKLTKKIQEEVKKSIGDGSTYREVLHDVQKSNRENNFVKNEKYSPDPEATENNLEKNQDRAFPEEKVENMPKRDSIYNVSSDIRLEDYVEEEQKKDRGSTVRLVLILLIFLLVAFGMWKLGVWLFAPKYYLSIANTEITEENYKSFLKNKQISLYEGQLLHIRFTYMERKHNFYTIQILRSEGGSLEEEAVFGRKIPRTVNYIYYAGTLDPGKYVVRVLNENRELVIEREIEIITP